MFLKRTLVFGKVPRGYKCRTLHGHILSFLQNLNNLTSRKGDSILSAFIKELEHYCKTFLFQVQFHERPVHPAYIEYYRNRFIKRLRDL